MKLFRDLFEKLDGTTSTLQKVGHLVRYFETASPADTAWAIYFLTGRRLNRLISSRDLRNWSEDLIHIPAWLYEETYMAVGDTAETVALLIDARIEKRQLPREDEASLAEWVEHRFLPLTHLEEFEQKRIVVGWWESHSFRDVFIINKLLTGSLRIGVSQVMVQNALAQWIGHPPATIAHRLMGEWKPTPQFIEDLKATELQGEGVSRPYPFFLASALEQEAPSLGPPTDWLAEWKWDGIRAQILNRGGKVFIWSRGEELITERFPEISAGAARLPHGTVLDGEILAFMDGLPMQFAQLQKRIQRKKLSPAILKSVPVVFMGFDCLEEDGKDIREAPLADRRIHLEKFLAFAPDVFRASPLHPVDSWERLAEIRTESRAARVEGLMLKRANSPYRFGRKRGDWWKWKVNPYSVDAVLLYAQTGHGKRANLFTDYTFAVWKGPELVPIAKAYSGLTDVEINELDKWIRVNTKERFGPVRSLTPAHVFEIAFEGISLSPRHKSGVAVRFPRILRWRRDKKIEDADTLGDLQGLIDAEL